MRLIDGDTVHRLLDYPTLVAALRRAHVATSMPATGELVLDDADDQGPGGKRSLIMLPAWQSGQLLGAKLVTVFPGNPARGIPLPANQGVYIAFDAETGTPKLVCDGTALTLRKTAADSALGADLLARPDAACLLMIGAGALAPHLIAAMRAVRPSIRTVWIWNRTPEKAQALARALASDELAVQAIDNLETVLPRADIVSSATMAETPLIRGALLRPGSHVDLVGSWNPRMREADDDAVDRARLFTDASQLCRDCGDFRQPVEAGLIGWGDIEADLFDLCSGRRPGRRSPDEVTLFKNCGGGHLDLFTAQELLRRLSSSDF